MIKPQQKQTPKQTDKIDIASTLPEIRTMQDDLARVRTTQKATQKEAVVSSSDKTDAKSIQTPPKPSTHTGNRRIRLILSAVIIFLVVSIGAGAGYWWISQNILGSDTIADYIPHDAEFVISSTYDAPSLSSRIFFVALDVLGLNEDLLEEDWSEIAYVILPGGSSADSVPLVVIASDQKPADTDGLSVVSLGESVWGIVQEERVGRVESTGKRLGSNRQIRSGSDEIATADGLLFVSEEATKRIHTSASDVNMPLYSESMVFVLHDESSHIEAQSINDENVRALLNETTQDVMQVPAEIEFITGNVAANWNDWITVLNNDPNAEGFIRAVADQPVSDAYDTLLELFAGPAVIGVRAAEGSVGQETIAVISLQDDSSDQAKDAMEVLEPAFLEFGPLLAGRAVESDSFMEHVYDDVVIRYANFPTMDRAVDYAIIDDTLLLTTSRDSMFELIQYIHEKQEGGEDIQEIINTVAPSKESWSWTANLQSLLYSGFSNPWKQMFGAIERISIYSSDGGAEFTERE